MYYSLKDEDRVERFLRSKSGEVITDYYSNDPSLNIVQRVDADDLGYVLSWKRDITISVENGFGCPSDYFFGLLVYEIRWIRFQSKFYKLVKPHGKDCTVKNPFDERNPWRRIMVYGNPFWITQEKEKMPNSSDNVEAYKGTSIESYVWQVAAVFDTEEAMNEDRKLFSEWTLSEEQIARVVADIPGDAG